MGAAGPDVSAATSVVVINHMMSEAELGDEEECKEIAEETVDKCNGDFGKVVALVIARPGREGVGAEELGKVFVQFADTASAIKAAQGLNNVKFDDRVVKTDFAVPARPNPPPPVSCRSHPASHLTPHTSHLTPHTSHLTLTPPSSPSLLPPLASRL
eukprot:1825526-Rhodomonas_salina.1